MKNGGEGDMIAHNKESMEMYLYGFILVMKQWIIYKQNNRNWNNTFQIKSTKYSSKIIKCYYNKKKSH